jgi:hypothetical protein
LSKKLFYAVILIGALAASARTFTHPGMLHGIGDLNRMRAMVNQGREPWKSGWNKLLAEPIASLDYKHHAVANLSVASGGAAGTGQQDDASAAHFHAIMWYVTKDEAHAKKAVEILNAWSYLLKTMGGTNAMLQTGIAGYHFCNAAEILRSTYTGWTQADQDQFKKMILEIFYPTIQNWGPKKNGNWDAYMTETMMSIGIFADSSAIFDKAVDWFYNGASQGSLKGYIFADGRCQESTRDQMHVQMGIGAMSGACETGYHQGLDMWGAYDNWFLRGLEFTAKYNLGYAVTGSMSSSGRGIIRPMWEISYNHYVKRKGLPAPYVTELVGKKRPEGYEQDYISLGTLLFYTDNNVPGGETNTSMVSLAPRAIRAVRKSDGGITLRDVLGREMIDIPKGADRLFFGRGDQLR